MPKKFITPAEYARREGFSLNYVYKLLVVGRLPAERIDGKWQIPVNSNHRKETTA